MRVKIISENGYSTALRGLSLNRNQPIDNMMGLSIKLAPKDGGHNKFLESICVWIEITAPRYYYQQLDQYRIGKSSQSESTMNTIMKRQLTQNDFERPIYNRTLSRLNTLIKVKDFDQLKIELPEGFLQRRIISTNYKTLRNIISQRKNHRLSEWKTFCSEILNQIEHPEFFEDLK